MCRLVLVACLLLTGCVTRNYSLQVSVRTLTCSACVRYDSIVTEATKQEKSSFADDRK